MYCVNDIFLVPSNNKPDLKSCLVNKNGTKENRNKQNVSARLHAQISQNIKNSQVCVHDD